MNFAITSSRFDVAASLCASAAYFTKWGTGSLIKGLQAFTVVNCVDRLMRSALANDVPKAPTPFKGIIVPFFEEGLYSGILLTNSKAWMIPRFASALILGMTALRGLVQPVTQGAGFTLDTKLAFIWAMTREAILFSLPREYSLPLLLVADSATFALCEVCGTKDRPGPPKFSNPWIYKTISAAFFRAVANYVALEEGLPASITQHLLFNFSRSLQ